MPEIEIGAVDEFVEGDQRVLAIGEHEVGIFRLAGAWRAYENHCPHAGGPVCQGKIYPRVTETLGEHRKSLGLHFTDIPQIVCPWHGYEFDIASGRHPGDATVRLRSYPVAVRDGRVYLSLPG